MAARVNTNNLSRVTLRKNPHYHRNGRKSYAYLLQKYNIGPTIDGPFAMMNQVEQSGSQAIMRKTGKKIGGKAYTSGQKLVMRDASGKAGDVPAETIQHDSEYLATVKIGTPPQSLDLDFDTGSADLWVWSSHLSEDIQTKGNKAGHHIFNSKQSSTFMEADGQWKISYGDGSSASGDVGTDTLQLGGISVEHQAIETAKVLSAQFQQNAGDGLLGLAFSTINTVTPTPAKSPVDNMIAQKDISNQLFTAYLGSWKDKKNPDHGESFYTFGYIDQDVLAASKDPLHYVPVNSSQGFWQFASPTATVNGKSISLPSNEAIADTGTTLAIVSDKVCEAIYAAIPGAKQDKTEQGWIFPTSVATSKLPIVQFAVGEKLFTVLGEDLQYADMGNGFYYGGVQSRGDLGFDILGDTFLKNVYAVFDLGGKRFGCVQKVEPESPKAVTGGGKGGNGPDSGSGSGKGQGAGSSLKAWFDQLVQTILGWFGRR